VLEFKPACGLCTIIQHRGARNAWRQSVTESQNHRMVGVGKGPLWVTQSNPPAEAGSPTAGCRGPCPGGSGISPEKETPPAPWAACSSAPSPSEGRSSSSSKSGLGEQKLCSALSKRSFKGEQKWSAWFDFTSWVRSLPIPVRVVRAAHGFPQCP